MTRSRARGATAKFPARLLRLNRRCRASLLVLGGTRAQRVAVARAFHAASPLRSRPFLAVDCAREESRLARGLQAWLLPDAGALSVNPLRESEGGTLYLDSVGCLSPSTQRLLLVLARRLQADAPEAPAEPTPYRLAIGNPEDLAEAVDERRFSEALLDCLDKIRVGLESVPGEGAA